MQRRKTTQAIKWYVVPCCRPLASFPARRLVSLWVRLVDVAFTLSASWHVVQESGGVLFNDIFSVTVVNPEGKKFDRGG